MFLRELINQSSPQKTWGNLDIDLSSLTDDSRKVNEGSCYIAIKGVHADGHHYINQAIEAKAAAIIAETAPSDDLLEKGISWVQVEDTRRVLPLLAATWYRFPANDMKMLAVTGTNGKTTTAYLIHSIFEQIQFRAGLIGTIVFNNGLESRPATHTTPGALELQELLSEMAMNDCRAVAMEASSHALTQNRVECIPFDVGVFTNLSQDHLDYHGDMETYFQAKKHLFDLLEETAKNKSFGKKPCAVINIDDKAGERLASLLNGKVNIRTYGFSAKADYRAVVRVVNGRGSEFELHSRDKSYMVKIPLIGRFNIYNALAALVASCAAGISIRNAIKALATAPQVPGRTELVGIKNNIQGFVDFAHTPDALTNVCRTLKELCKGKLITVFGCGGDRDKGKRPLMGNAASEFSDYCIVTSDNPRSEDPESIINDILPGMEGSKYRSITDRKEAIRVAVELATPGDFVLVAGKGHEDYQEFAEGKVPFNDKITLRMCLENWGNDQ